MSIVSTVRLCTLWALPGGAVEAQRLSNGGASGPSPVEQRKHKVFAIVDLLRRLPLPAHLLGRVQLLVAQTRRHLLGGRNGVACG